MQLFRHKCFTKLIHPTGCFNNKEEATMDDNGRIYHCLTTMPKDLLFCTNIKFEMDCSNCHPLLFVGELAKYYSIGDEALKRIIDSSGDDISYELNIPIDVVDYIRITSQGKFWDIILSKYDLSTDDRNYIKQKYFAEIFYSYNNSIQKYKKVGDTYSFDGTKLFAKDFIENYPNVWEVLGYLKRQGFEELKSIKDTETKLHSEVMNELFKELGYGKYREESTKDSIKNNVLPKMLMRFESKIFHEILERCYAQDIEAINIHDAIVVIDTPKNKLVTERDIESIISDVFNKHHLYPRIKCGVPECDIACLTKRLPYN